VFGVLVEEDADGGGVEEAFGGAGAAAAGTCVGVGVEVGDGVGDEDVDLAELAAEAPLVVEVAGDGGVVEGDPGCVPVTARRASPGTVEMIGWVRALV